MPKLTKEEITYFQSFHRLYKNDPIAWVRDVLNVEKLEPYQIEALVMLEKKHYVSMATGTGVGKTAILAWAGLWFLTSRPGCNVLATAPTAGQLKSCLWKEMTIWIKKSHNDVLLKMLDHNQEKIWVKGSKDDWFILGRTASPDTKTDASESMSGIHSDRGVLFLVDESTGVPESVFAALEGSFTAEESYSIMACFKDTEQIQTNEGWKDLKSLTGDEYVLSQDEDGVASYYPIKKVMKYKHDGDLIEFKNLSGSLTVTSNHRIPFKKNSTIKSYHTWTAEEIYNEAQNNTIPYLIPKKVNWEGSEKESYIFNGKSYPMDDWLKFLGWFISEGSLDGKDGKPYRISISQSIDVNSHKRELIIDCITKLGFKTTFNGNDIRFSNIEIGEHLLEIVGRGCDKKVIPNFIGTLSPRQIKLFLEAYLLGDGYIQEHMNKKEEIYPQKVYVTTSKAIAEELQNLIIKSGAYASIKQRKDDNDKCIIKGREIKGTKPVYRVFERTTEHASFRGDQMSKVPYNGYVYCVEVDSPSHLVYTKDPIEQYPIWSHNSNPMRIMGSFYRSHHEEKELWHTMQISSEDSARVDKAYIKRMEGRWGKNHPIYRSKVKGLFPRNSGEEMVLFNDYIDRLKENLEAEDIPPQEIVVGLDVARYGNDQSVMIIRIGYKVVDITSLSNSDIIETTNWAWERLKTYFKGYPEHQIEINVDAIGLGAGVADGLIHKARQANREMKFRKEPILVFAVEYSKKAEDVMYANVRAESFFNARDMMKKCSWHKDVDNTIVLKDLKDIGFNYDRNGKILIESKDDIKKRNYGVSPDFGDAFILCMNSYKNYNYETVRKTIRDKQSLATRSSKLHKQSVFKSGSRLSNQRWSA